LEHRTAATLPTPTGTFAVGRALYDWADDETLDTLAPVPGTKRELLVWIWYPSAAGQSVAMDDYLPAQMQAAAKPNGGLLRLLTRDLAKVHGHSSRDSDVSPQPRSYPLVIMRAGASVEVWNYSTLAEDLASHGYVVVGFDAPYRTYSVVFPDGRVMRRTPENNPELCEDQEQAQQARCVNKVLTAWTADIAFVLDQLERLNVSDPTGKVTGRLDMTRVGVFGHSFGGATLFAALNVLDGKVIGECHARHRHQEWLRFLRRLDGEFPPQIELHLVMDNYGTHKEPQVQAWLKKHPRFVSHFIPTSSSWLNLVERWFRELSDKAIKRASFVSVPDLKQAIEEFMRSWNENPKPFIWTATVEGIIKKIERARVKMEQIKPGSTLPRGRKKKE